MTTREALQRHIENCQKNRERLTHQKELEDQVLEVLLTIRNLLQDNPMAESVLIQYAQMIEQEKKPPTQTP